MASRTDVFARRLSIVLADAAIARVRSKIPSRTLQKALHRRQWTRGRSAFASAYIPHYWAIMVHEGRKAFAAPNGQLIWFRNPHDDPRLRAGVTPVRVKHLRRMTHSDFVFWSEKNREAIAAGNPPPMIIAERIINPTPARRFFDNGNAQGMLGFRTEAGAIAQRMFSAHVKEVLGPDFRAVERLTIRLGGV